MFSGGLLLTSQADELWQGYLSYGLGAGLGGGLFTAPVFAAVAGWFDRYRAVGGLGMARPPVRRHTNAGRRLRSVLRTRAFRRLAFGCALYSAGQIEAGLGGADAGQSAGTCSGAVSVPGSGSGSATR